MKKTFHLESEKLKPLQQQDSVRHEIKKYMARERRKKLPEGFDFWEFDCRFGNTPEDTFEISEYEIKNSITTFVSNQKKTFYIEIMARPGKKPSKETGRR